MKNLELKVKYASDIALKLANKLELSESFDLIQVDTYYKVNQGRLKLRSINNKDHELIWYQRADRIDAKESTYEIFRTKDPEQMKLILKHSLGIKVIVEKHRQAFIYKDCRIHIDKVSQLGEFLEFEVVMIPDRTEQEANELMDFLIRHFNIKTDQLINVSYSDLLLNMLYNN
ncbi:MAG: class IV adenylate cyclase [Cyanobacteriota bacterium]